MVSALLTAGKTVAVTAPIMVDLTKERLFMKVYIGNLKIDYSIQVAINFFILIVHTRGEERVEESFLY
jgi:hypothetical protein